jgi:EAL domain-containing protein (putative c-di-GMP-specific phosphodiesterase class I)
MFKCQAILRLGEMHDIGVIAECVETSEALQRLKACGIGFAQGYGICRPYPIDSPTSSKPA